MPKKRTPKRKPKQTLADARLWCPATLTMVAVMLNARGRTPKRTLPAPLTMAAVMRIVTQRPQERTLKRMLSHNARMRCPATLRMVVVLPVTRKAQERKPTRMWGVDLVLGLTLGVPQDAALRMAAMSVTQPPTLGVALILCLVPGVGQDELRMAVVLSVTQRAQKRTRTRTLSLARVAWNGRSGLDGLWTTRVTTLGKSTGEGKGTALLLATLGLSLSGP